MAWRELTAEETRVIVAKGTEQAFTGKYDAHWEPGTYLCRRCGATLFDGGDKFDSGCGWPSFDAAMPGAVDEITDADGRRVEIVCANCAGHLGHVFRGERATRLNTRHCVNSISIDFAPAGADRGADRGAAGAAASTDAPKDPPAAGSGAKEPDAKALASASVAYFAGGCFWGVEHLLEQVEGILDVRSGYMGGHVDQPTYEQVCGGDTGHAEVVEVRYDAGRVSYHTIARVFFEIHDPTQADGQGPDIGPQYRSAVFVGNDAERATVQRLIAALRGRGFNVATTVEPAATFWPAESYHQDYYRRKGGEPYCHTRVARFSA